MLSARDFFDDGFWKACKQDMDNLLAFRKTLKGKPDVYDKVQIELNKVFIEFYKTVLFHVAGDECGCPACVKKKDDAPIKELLYSRAESAFEAW